MGVGVNARTAFSLLFPPILAEFGWERGVIAGAFSFGFLISPALSPALGRLMDRRGPRVVMGPGGDRAAGRGLTAARPTNGVDPAWASIDWTLGRAMATARFWWIALGYSTGLFAWYAVQVHQTKYLVEIGFSATYAAWAL